MKLNNIMIFGDSYSTFEGYVPAGYGVYYSPVKHPESAVQAVEKTWWHRLVTDTGANLMLNDSWSGSTIGYTGYEGKDASSSSSFIYRLRRLSSEGFFNNNKIDTVFVFGGTNDNWCGAPLGDAKFEDWDEKDLYNVLSAIPHFLSSLKKELPDASVICIINSGFKPEVKESFLLSCERYDITPVILNDIEKAEGHPTDKGMEQIAKQILDVIS